MLDQPRFTLTLTLRDNHGFDEPLQMAVSCDEALRISARAVEETKIGVYGDWNAVASLLRTREMRRKLFEHIATSLGVQMADRLEDAEGWHDPERIEPARKSLGGKRW